MLRVQLSQRYANTLYKFEWFDINITIAESMFTL